MGARAENLSAHGDDFAWSLLDAAPDATLVVSADGVIEFANDHAGDLLGRRPDDLLGQVVEDLLPEDVRAVHREHRAGYRADPAGRPMGAGLELRARRGDGSEIPVEISLSPLCLGDEVHVIATIRDVTDRVEADDLMHRVLHALDASDDGLFIFDAETLRYSFVNDGACRLVGYTEAELLQMTPLHLNPNMTEADYRSVVDSLLDGREETLLRRATLRHRDGEEVPVEKTLRGATTDGGRTPWVIVLARDISSRLAADAELEESRQIMQQAEKAIAVADDRERIARDLHDTVIQRMFAEGLHLQTALNVLHDPARARPRIEAAVQSLDETIKDLRIAIFSLESGRGSTGVGLRARLLEVITEATASLGFEPHVQFEGPIDLLDDDIATNIVPVLRESLANVAKHAQASRVRVSIRAGDDVELTVSDDGIGPDDGVSDGHGMLNMARRAHDLGGQLLVQAVDPHGSRLSWRVPTES